MKFKCAMKGKNCIVNEQSYCEILTGVTSKTWEYVGEEDYSETKFKFVFNKEQI